MLFTFVNLHSQVIDSGGMFSSQAVNKANERLSEIKRQSKKEMVVETIESLNGKNVSEFALENARKKKVNGIYVLIVKKEKKISIKVGSKTQKVFGRNETGTLKTKFTEEFKAKNFDNGLLAATDYFGQVITTSPQNKRSQASNPPPVAKASREGSSFPWLTIIIVAIIGFLIFRVIGFFISRMMGGGASGQYGPSGGGFGGGGGPGIMGSIMGGLFGAMAGSWLYDQFTGNDGLFANSNQDSMTGSESYDSWSGQDDGSSYSDDSGSFDGGDWDSGGDW